MRYRIKRDIVIRSENAAKPEAQSSKFLESMIAALPSVPASFDYGCGKLRYRNAMLASTENLFLVDSEIQLSRQQVIGGQNTNIRTYVETSNRMHAFNVQEFTNLPKLFNRGFCINVLSVIPIEVTKRRVLSIIRSKLYPGGQCLFVVQYRNSDFNRMLAMPNAKVWRNGILIDSLRGHSFYGLIRPEQLTDLLHETGFETIFRKLNEGSVYLMARVPE